MMGAYFALWPLLLTGNAKPVQQLPDIDRATGWVQDSGDSQPGCKPAYKPGGRQVRVDAPPDNPLRQVKQDRGDP